MAIPDRLSCVVQTLNQLSFCLLALALVALLLLQQAAGCWGVLDLEQHPDPEPCAEAPLPVEEVDVVGLDFASVF